MEYEEFSESTKKRGRYPVSGWRIADLMVACIVFFAIMKYGSFRYYAPAAFLAMLLIPILLLARRLYRKDKVRSRFFKVFTGIIRTALYTYGIGALLIHATLDYSKPMLYPLQRVLYGSNKQMEEFLPEKLPTDMREYDCSFKRFPFPGASSIKLSFYTSDETIEKLREKALAAGASETPEDSEAKSNWLKSELIEKGKITENVQMLYFPYASEHFPFCYILDTETGYVEIFY